MKVNPRLDAVEIYVLQGRLVRIGDELLHEVQGLIPRRLSGGTHLHLVFRIDNWIPAESVVRFALERISTWERAGQPVSGVQIDFDSPTSRLAEYSEFLQTLRGLLPPRYRLSVTGLGDWLVAAPVDALAALYHSMQEIFFQLYQKDVPLLGEVGLIARLAKFHHPFRVGLLTSQFQHWERYQTLQANPYFGGAVVFR